MFKRKRQPKRKKRKLLSRLRKPANTTSTTIYPTVRRNEFLVIKTTGIRKDPDDYDKKAYAYAVLQVATDKCIKEAEDEMVALKGNRSKQATAQRKALRAKIEALHTQKRRFQGRLSSLWERHD